MINILTDFLLWVRKAKALSPDGDRSAGATTGGAVRGIKGGRTARNRVTNLYGSRVRGVAISGRAGHARHPKDYSRLKVGERNSRNSSVNPWEKTGPYSEKIAGWSKLARTDFRR